MVINLLDDAPRHISDDKGYWGGAMKWDID